MTIRLLPITIAEVGPWRPEEAQVDPWLRQTLLWDFYGELLTERQRRAYGDAIGLDMSLGELAKEVGISRQGVHDLLRRSQRQLEAYEEKLGLVRRFSLLQERARQIEALCQSEAWPAGAEGLREEIFRLAREIGEEL